jgi:hypothetical protein
VKHTILACGESSSVTVVDLTEYDQYLMNRVFAAVNSTAEANDNYSPLLYLFPGEYDDPNELVGRLPE